MTGPVIHIFAQYREHDEARIVGNRAGLLALQDAVTKALSEKVATVDTMAGDGEGYELTVQLRNGAGMSRGMNHYIQRHMDGYVAYERQFTARSDAYHAKKIRELQAEIAALKAMDAQSNA